jgi:hypothetical protein
MSTGQQGVYGDLVAGLLDARDSPASDRFDEELAAAVATGDLTADGARRLKLWQNAAVAELADHVRTVLPATLNALAEARAKAARRVHELAAVADLPAAPERHVREHAARVPTRPAEHRDTPEPASITPLPAASSLESRPARMMVADLVVTRTPAHTTHS